MVTLFNGSRFLDQSYIFEKHVGRIRDTRHVGEESTMELKSFGSQKKAGDFNDSMRSLNDHAKITGREESIHEPFLGCSEVERIGGQQSRDSDLCVEWTRCTHCLMCSRCIQAKYESLGCTISCALAQCEHVPLAQDVRIGV
jgi:hypothetical protein